jgi:phosphatidyl-myo-inositol dimannoside synthase
LISLFYRKIQITAIIHGSEVSIRSSFTRTLTHSALKCFPRIISVSNHSASFVSLKAHQKLKIIPNGINSEYLNSIDSDTEMHLHGDPIFLTVGNISSRKGQVNFIRALPEIIRVFPCSMYYCAGLPTEKETFLAEASFLNVQEHIVFTGRVSEEELIYLYKNCDIFIMLSKTQKSGDTEGFGIAVLEANHFGKAAIGSLFTGIEDAIENAVSGYLVDPENPQEILTAIKNILNNQKAFEVQAKAHAHKHEWNNIIQNYIDFISEL